MERREEEEEESRLDATWHALTLPEKRALLSSPASETLNPDTLRLIARWLGRDPWSFFALAGTCRTARDALGADFYPYADTGYLQIWIERLCRRAPPLSVISRRTFDEKARYVILGHIGQAIVCEVDKYTGLVLNTEHTRSAGSVATREPEAYFARWNGAIVGLKSSKQMAAEDAAYVDTNKRNMAIFAAATEKLKQTSKFAKKRLFSAVWDESELRRKRYKGK
jgi:hypothetical protein